MASQSFCVIDKGTYLYNNPDEFGIKYRNHHLYWESNNGENDFCERFKRYEEFCKLALSLGIPETSGVLKNKPDKWQLLGDYYFYKKEYNPAIEHYVKAEQVESKNRYLLNRLSECYEEVGVLDKAKETLGHSLQLSSESGGNGTSDESIKR